MALEMVIIQEVIKMLGITSTDENQTIDNQTDYTEHSITQIIRAYYQS